MRRPTLADIARAAGVSVATASRALNASPAIPAVTRQRVLAAAAQMNYRVNERARNFRLGRSGTVAVLFPYQEASRRQLSDPFYVEITSAIMEEVDAAGCDLLIARVPVEAAGEPEWTRRYTVDQRVDGVIVIDRPVADDHLRRLHAAGAPFVVWGQRLADQPYVSVGGDSVIGAGLAVERLIAAGRRRIGFIGGFGGMVETEYRRRGYLAALTAGGLPIDPARLHVTDFSPDGGSAAMTALLTADPAVDAVFVCSDFMAVAVLEVIRRAGRRVPDDIAVIGYDDLPLAAYAAPPLTTIRQPIHAGGRELVRQLLALIAGQPAASVTLPVDLIVRDSG